jgi:hypothetical protein
VGAHCDQARVNRNRSSYVVNTATTIIREPAPIRSPLKDDRLVFLGADREDVLLEVMAVETDIGLLVIHAMRMRAKYERHLRGKP